MLAGCGGSGSSGGTIIEDPDTGGGGEQVGGSGGPAVNFADFLDLNSTHLAGVDASHATTLSEFAKANLSPDGFYTGASFNGSMFVQMGPAERY